MRYTRLALISVLSTLALGTVAMPVAAQSSASAELINGLNGKLLYVGIPITILVEAILIYTVIKFRNNDDATPTQENRRLEITWTVATALILLFVGVASYGVLANENITYQPEAENAAGEAVNGQEQQPEPVVVYAEAYQWGWEMSYPEAGNFTNGNTMVIPADRPVVIQTSSRDVIHGFHVPKMALKTDSMPGQVNTIKTVPYETGSYQGYCTQFCGVAHSQMYFTVDVVPQDEYQQWLTNQQNSAES